MVNATKYYKFKIINIIVTYSLKMCFVFFRISFSASGVCTYVDTFLSQDFMNLFNSHTRFLKAWVYKAVDWVLFFIMLLYHIITELYILNQWRRTTF